MNRMFRAGLLALPLALAASQTATANDRPGLAGTRWGCNQYGCQGFCLNLFPHISAHGPLVNYGPYSGYYPFAPYGPWDENLRYNGPRGYDNCGWGGRACGLRGCGRCGGLLSNWGGFARGGCGHSQHHNGCDSCGWRAYAGHTFRNVLHRINPFHGHRPACSTCAP